MLTLEPIIEFMRANGQAAEPGGKFEVAFRALITEINKELAKVPSPSLTRADAPLALPNYRAHHGTPTFAHWACLNDSCPVRKPVEYPFAPQCYTCGDAMNKVSIVEEVPSLTDAVSAEPNLLTSWTNAVTGFGVV